MTKVIMIIPLYTDKKTKQTAVNKTQLTTQTV